MLLIMHDQYRHQLWEYNLLLLIAVLILASLAHFPLHHEPLHLEIAVSIIPLGIAVFLIGVCTYQLQQKSDSEQISQISKFTWWGALISVALSGWWIILVFYWGQSIVGVGDHILLVVSAGTGAGAVVGIGVSRQQWSEKLEERDRLLKQTTWVDRSSPNPILETIIEQIAEVEGIESTELDPLYDCIDVTVFNQLNSEGSSPWELTFYTDEYEIIVASYGTVAVYENRLP